MEEIMDILIEEIDVLENYKICLFESRTRDGGTYLSIKQNENVIDMQGEILISPCNVPELIKALIEVVVKLEGRSMYFSVYQDGKGETY